MVEFAQLDLADLGSVRRFAASYRDREATLNLLVNNASVVLVPGSDSTTEMTDTFDVT
jgi:NAD(P)-dependent dehydrogenase (short-subunit alcohol dehydrogenase family)